MQLEYHHKFRIEKKIVQYPLQLSDVNGVGEVAKDDKILESLKTINYSPSSLLVYKTCPMKFYFQYVMKLREDEEVSEDVDSGSFGDIFHYVMESVYKENNGEMTAEFLRKVAGNSDYLNAMVKRAYKEKMNISELEGKNILISYLIARKKEKIQTGLIILASGISLVLLSSAMVTLTSGTMPVFMLAEPFILLGAIAGFVTSVIKARKSGN